MLFLHWFLFTVHDILTDKIDCRRCLTSTMTTAADGRFPSTMPVTSSDACYMLVSHKIKRWKTKAGLLSNLSPSLTWVSAFFPASNEATEQNFLHETAMRVWTYQHWEKRQNTRTHCGLSGAIYREIFEVDRVCLDTKYMGGWKLPPIKKGERIRNGTNRPNHLSSKCF